MWPAGMPRCTAPASPDTRGETRTSLGACSLSEEPPSDDLEKQDAKGADVHLRGMQATPLPGAAASASQKHDDSASPDAEKGAAGRGRYHLLAAPLAHQHLRSWHVCQEEQLNELWNQICMAEDRLCSYIFSCSAMQTQMLWMRLACLPSGSRPPPACSQPPRSRTPVQ